MFHSNTHNKKYYYNRKDCFSSWKDKDSEVLNLEYPYNVLTKSFMSKKYNQIYYENISVKLSSYIKKDSTFWCNPIFPKFYDYHDSIDKEYNQLTTEEEDILLQQLSKVCKKGDIIYLGKESEDRPLYSFYVYISIDGKPQLYGTEYFYYFENMLSTGDFDEFIPIVGEVGALGIGFTEEMYMYLKNEKIARYDYFPALLEIVKWGYDKGHFSRDMKKIFTADERKNKKPTILLLGDSIIDNAAWNDVGTDTTAEYLKRMGLTVIDRAAEEAYTDKFFKFFDGTNPGIIVGGGYVSERKRKGIPYDGFNKNGSYYVLPVPESSNTKWWGIPKEDRYAVISLGGNDLVLVGNFDVEKIQQNVSKIINKLITSLDMLPKNFMYLIPYSPNKQLADYMTPMLSQSGMTVEEFYKNWVKNTKKMCQNLGITCVSLSDFTDADRYNTTHIPEPTKQGARKIAERINNVIKS